jgi:hypothetical protein
MPRGAFGLHEQADSGGVAGLDVGALEAFEAECGFADGDADISG